MFKRYVHHLSELIKNHNNNLYIFDFYIVTELSKTKLRATINRAGKTRTDV